MTVTLIGGEMLLWSDLDATHGPAPAGGAASQPLLAAVSGRTLVAGPHDPSLIDAIPAEQITVLVRGVADAEALATRYAGRPGITVWCGSLEKVAAVPAYDTVLALDGLDRLCSAEADYLTWDETLAQLVAVLRPAGRLLLGAENLFGLHRLVALPADPADTDWVVPDDHDPTRPAGPAALRDRLAAAGVPVVREFAAYPSPVAPSVLLGPAILADPGLAGFVEATLTTACAAATDVLADPVRLAAGAVRHGLTAELAPAWIVLAQRDPSADGGAPWPDAVVATGDTAREIRLAADAADDLPRGRVLAGLMLAACQRRDLPALRALLTGWQSGPAAGIPADRVVVDADGGYTGLAPAEGGFTGLAPAAGGFTGLAPAAGGFTGLASAAGGFTGLASAAGGVTGPAPAEGGLTGLASAEGGFAGQAPAEAPLLAMRHFAALVIDGGYAHLWPGPAGEPELTAVLAGMIGRELEPGAVPPGSAPDGPGSVRELTMARDRLARELAEARAKHEWYEQMLVTREAELKRVRQINTVLSATVPGRAATTLVGGLRAGKRAVRAVVRRTRG